MGDKYAVDGESAGKVASDARALLPDLETLKTTVTSPLSDAEGALPPEFATAIALLKTLREHHERDIKKVKKYATSCIDALDGCLAIYENSSAEMVAEQKATESKVSFEHPGLLDAAAKPGNEWLDKKEKRYNDALPNQGDGGKSWDRGIEHVNNSEEKSTTHTSSSTQDGVTTTRASKRTSGFEVSNTTTTDSKPSFAERQTVAHTTTASGATSTTNTYYRAGHKPEVSTQ